ncbi:hypothetical protein ABPG72_019665 [Tetrahymena utriculariae]
MKVKQILAVVGIPLLLVLVLGVAIYASHESSETVLFKKSHNFRDNNVKINMFSPKNQKCIDKCKATEVGGAKGYNCGQKYQVCCVGEDNCKKGSWFDTCKQKVTGFFCEEEEDKHI